MEAECSINYVILLGSPGPHASGILVPEIPLAKYLPNISTSNEECYVRWKETLIPEPGYLTDAQPLHITELFKLSWLT